MRTLARFIGCASALGRALPCGLALLLAPAVALAQGATSVYVQDQTTAANGGPGRAQGAADALQQALKDANPCVETADEQDVKDAIGDARDSSLQEGTDPTERLKQIGQMVGANIVVGIQAMSAPGGGTMYSAFAMDAKTGRTIARAMGSQDQVVKSLVQQLAGGLATQCTPHWVGTISQTGSLTESTTVDDKGPMLAARRNVQRHKTTSFSAQTTMTATLLPPSAGTRALNSPMARVVQIVSTVARTEQHISGEAQCRMPGRNPYWENFSERFSETTTAKGRATGTSPVFILVDGDGRYTIRVTVPGGETIGTYASERQPSQACGASAQPDKDLVSAPPATFDASSFDAEGKVDPKNRNTLAGSVTSPDGRTTTRWNLRLVKPAGK